MDLSARVSQGPKKADADGKPIKKSRNSPFNAMNTTTVPRDLQLKAAQHVSAAEEKRVMRHVKGGRGKPTKEKEPMKALKMQRALASVSYERRSKTKLELAERDRFEEFDLLDEIKESVPVQALGGLDDIAPTPIQRLAIPALLGTEDGKRRKKFKEGPIIPPKKEMKQFLLAAETGSGKTLAYVLPVIDALKRAEALEAQQEAEAREQEKQQQSKHKPGQSYELPSPEVDDPHHTTGRPKVIILVPTQELVAQVGALVKSLSHTVKFRAAMISANYSSTIIRNRLFSPHGIDIVVSTPHLLNSITESDPNVLSRVSHLIIDEADSLLDRSFAPLTSSIIDRATPSLQQLILCSATIPRSLDTYLHKRYPSIRRLTTPNLHAIPRRVQLTVVDIDKIPYQGNRDLTCAQVIWDIGKEADSDGHVSTIDKRILVFVNEREKADEVATYLQGKGIDATALSRDTSDRNSDATLAAFTGTSTSAQLAKQQKEDAKKAESGERRLRGVKVLVTTDIASRGIDTTAAKTVILYTVPHTSIDFIHRLGRVGRMGRRGRGIVLVGRGDRKDVVREVRDGMFKGMALI
jgi:ATP-dependent RNA helicase MRH4